MDFSKNMKFSSADFWTFIAVCVFTSSFFVLVICDYNDMNIDEKQLIVNREAIKQIFPKLSKDLPYCAKNLEHNRTINHLYIENFCYFSKL